MEIKFSALSNPGDVWFNKQTDYIRFIDIFRKNPKIIEVELNSQEHFENILSTSTDFIPLMINRDNEILLISIDLEYKFKVGDTLAYIGKFE